MKIMYRSGCVAFEPSPSGFKVYVFNDEDYLEAPVGGEDCFDVLNAFIEAIFPVAEEIEKEMSERVERIKKDLEFFASHKWDTKEKEKELKAVESGLMTLRNIKENLKNTRSLVEAFLKPFTGSTDC